MAIEDYDLALSDDFSMQIHSRLVKGVVDNGGQICSIQGTVDPETGQPLALAVVQGFGPVVCDATFLKYNLVIWTVAYMTGERSAILVGTVGASLDMATPPKVTVVIDNGKPKVASKVALHKNSDHLSMLEAKKMMLAYGTPMGQSPFEKMYIKEMGKQKKEIFAQEFLAQFPPIDEKIEFVPPPKESLKLKGKWKMAAAPDLDPETDGGALAEMLFPLEKKAETMANELGELKAPTCPVCYAEVGTCPHDQTAKSQWFNSQWKKLVIENPKIQQGSPEASIIWCELHASANAAFGGMCLCAQKTCDHHLNSEKEKHKEASAMATQFIQDLASKLNMPLFAQPFDIPKAKALIAEELKKQFGATSVNVKMGDKPGEVKVELGLMLKKSTKDITLHINVPGSDAPKPVPMENLKVMSSGHGDLIFEVAPQTKIHTVKLFRMFPGQQLDNIYLAPLYMNEYGFDINVHHHLKQIADEKGGALSVMAGSVCEGEVVIYVAPGDIDDIPVSTFEEALVNFAKVQRDKFAVEGPSATYNVPIIWSAPMDAHVMDDVATDSLGLPVGITDALKKKLEEHGTLESVIDTDIMNGIVAIMVRPTSLGFTELGPLLAQIQEHRQEIQKEDAVKPPQLSKNSVGVLVKKQAPLEIWIHPNGNEPFYFSSVTHDSDFEALHNHLAQVVHPYKCCTLETEKRHLYVRMVLRPTHNVGSHLQMLVDLAKLAVQPKIPKPAEALNAELPAISTSVIGSSVGVITGKGQLSIYDKPGSTITHLSLHFGSADLPSELVVDRIHVKLPDILATLNSIATAIPRLRMEVATDLNKHTARLVFYNAEDISAGHPIEDIDTAIREYLHPSKATPAETAKEDSAVAIVEKMLETMAGVTQKSATEKMMEMMTASKPPEPQLTGQPTFRIMARWPDGHEKEVAFVTPGGDLSKAPNAWLGELLKEFWRRMRHHNPVWPKYEKLLDETSTLVERARACGFEIGKDFDWQSHVRGDDVSPIAHRFGNVAANIPQDPPAAPTT